MTFKQTDYGKKLADDLSPAEPEVLPGGQQLDTVEDSLPPADIDNFPIEGDDEFELMPSDIPEDDLEDDLEYGEDSTLTVDELDDYLDEVGGGDLTDSEMEQLTRSAVTLSDGTIVGDPLGNVTPRERASLIIERSTISPDENLLDLFIDDNRMRDLFEQIEALQEEIVDSVRASRGNSDVYQEELLLASNMLLSSRENYDEARAIVYRIRADLNRERRVDAEIKRYRPFVVQIYIAMIVHCGL